VLERVYAEAYAPFFETLARHPGVKIAAHHSGSLLTWLEDAHPEYLDRLSHLVERGQVELLTGGFYEPVLAAIPDADRVGQIEKQTAWLSARFGRTPVGLWLAERVWEPDLPSSLSRAGVKYTLLDDTHFLSAGADVNRLDGPYLTEDRGRTVHVLPISKRLRYLVPFHEPQETIDFLRQASELGAGRVFVLGDDGEKFGHWPDTHKRVYEEGWLDRFLSLLEENRSWLRTACPSDVMSAVRGRIYLPTTSYEEMGEWTLPARLQARFHAVKERVTRESPDDARFLSGGTWRSFLGRYPESDRMYQRGLALRDEASALTDASASARARDVLWSAQQNCPYWHGVFGGVYLPHLRDAVWTRLLEAERIIVEAQHPGDAGWVEAKAVDLDADGDDEVLLRNNALSAVVDPAWGALVELSARKERIALQNGLMRRYEAYHDRLRGPAGDSTTDGVASIHDRFEVKEVGLDAFLVYDDYPRMSVFDHWLRSDQDRGAFERGQLPDPIGLRGTWRVAIAREPEGAHAVLRRATADRALVIEKTVGVMRDGARMRVAYRVETMARSLEPGWFGMEWNFAMLDARSPGRRFRIEGEGEERSLGSSGETGSVRGVTLIDRDRGFQVTLRWNLEARLWWAPVETVSLSESGLERVYQSTALLPTWSWSARPGEPLLLDLTLEIAPTA